MSFNFNIPVVLGILNIVSLMFVIFNHLSKAGKDQLLDLKKQTDFNSKDIINIKKDLETLKTQSININILFDKVNKLTKEQTTLSSQNTSVQKTIEKLLDKVEILIKEVANISGKIEYHKDTLARLDNKVKGSR